MSTSNFASLTDRLVSLIARELRAGDEESARILLRAYAAAFAARFV
jgi:hypothetical protein